jgi:hypothetical protein
MADRIVPSRRAVIVQRPKTISMRLRLLADEIIMLAGTQISRPITWKAPGNAPEKSFLEAGKVKHPWRKEAPKTNACDITVISWIDIEGRLSG